MRVVLKIVSGPFTGHSVLLRPGQTIRVGRTEWADFSVPDDNRLSSVHFSLECDDQTCRLRDLESTNGTLVNGQTALEALLNNGDTIQAGRTSFVVEVDIDKSSITSSVANIVTPPPRPPVADPILVTVAEKTFLAPILQAAAASGRPYEQAFAHEDPGVRREAFLAAVWTRQSWLLEYCRAVATQPTPEHWEALWLLAVLGKPSDLDRILTVGRTASLGVRRFSMYGSYGHPRTVRDVIVGIGSKDPNTAVAAAAAFTRITGLKIDSDKQTTLPPEDGSQPDEFEQEFLAEAALPDPQKAEEHWQAVKDQFAEGVRWHRGRDVSQGVTAETLAQLDMEGRYEASLRGRYEGTLRITRQQLEQFPMR